MAPCHLQALSQEAEGATMTADISKTIGLAKPSRRRRGRILRCVETGESASSANWADELSRKLGTERRSVLTLLAYAVRSGRPIFGLHFEVVS